MPDHRSPAEGKRRRLPKPKRRPAYLNSIEQIDTVLEAAEELDRRPQNLLSVRQPIVATLILAGLRAHELCSLRWGDVDLANGRLRIETSKTQAGIREVDLAIFLRDILAAHKAKSTKARPRDLVFPTRNGRARSKDNLRGRILLPALQRADELLEERGLAPLPQGLSPHKLRHTFASILIACGEDPASVMAPLGHTHPSFTLSVYTHMMRRGPGERGRLKALMKGESEEALEQGAATTAGAR